MLSLTKTEETLEVHDKLRERKEGQKKQLSPHFCLLGIPPCSPHSIEFYPAISVAVT
jgi:hypothetical protein